MLCDYVVSFSLLLGVCLISSELAEGHSHNRSKCVLNVTMLVSVSYYIADYMESNSASNDYSKIFHKLTWFLSKIDPTPLVFVFVCVCVCVDVDQTQSFIHTDQEL